MKSTAFFFNSQPHINDLKDGLIANEKHQSDVFTFMLKHKHFDLEPGEVLYVERNGKDYDVSVATRESIARTSPCMWLYSDGWKPFAYTKSEFGYENNVDMPEGDYNLGMRWLNNGRIERTDEANRKQFVRSGCKDSVREETMITCVNWEAQKSVCVVTYCEKDNNGKHVRIHTVVSVPRRSK